MRNIANTTDIANTADGTSAERVHTRTTPKKTLKTRTGGAMRKNGRPTKYTKALAGKIFVAVVTTDKGLIHICAEHKGFPHRATIHRWLLKNYGFCDMYDRAKLVQIQLCADDLLMVARTPLIGRRIRVLPDGTRETTISDNVARSALIVDAIKFNAVKLLRHKYGEKLDGKTKRLEVIIKGVLDDDEPDE